MRSLLRGLLLVAAACGLYGQEFRANISGTVIDPAGAVVPKALVQVTDVERNTTTKAETNDSGRYTVQYLVPGKYRLSVEAGGFKQFVRDDIVLAINDHLGLDVTLEIGSSSERVTVTGEVSPLQTESASRGGLVFSQFVNDVPNNGRDMFNLVFAMPGVYKPSTSQNNGFNIDAIGNALPNINGNAGGTGGRTWNTDVLINGISDTQGNNNLVMTPGLAAIQELNVMTNTYDAQYGRTGGGIVSVSTKSGTNQIHGQIFDRLQDSTFAANTWSNNRVGQPKASSTVNNYGFEVDGPIVIPKVLDLRDKMFFMLSMDRSGSDSVATRTATVPLPGMINGDFSSLVAANGAPVLLYDPTSTRLNPDGVTYSRDLFPGNIIPSHLINPVGANIISYFPAANSEGVGAAHTNNFVGTTPEKTITPQWIGRLDYRLNDKHAFYGEYGETAYERNGGFIWANAADPSTQAPRGVRGRHLTLDWSYILSPTLTFDLRTGFARAENTAANFYETGFNPLDLGFSQSLVSQMAALHYPQILFSDYTGQGGVGYFTGDDTYDTQASMSKVLGTHIMKFGGEVRSFRDTSVSPGNSSGNYTFARNWTQADPMQGDSNSGNAIADLLLGYPSSGFIQIPNEPAYSGWQYVLFFQDDWKLTSRLSLNLGLRWDYQTPEVERYNRQSRGFGLDVASPLASAVRSAPGAENCPACANLLGAYQFAGASGTQRYAYRPDRNDFQPRIGVAYSLNSKTVFRGGFGMYKLGVYIVGSPDGFSSTTPVVPSEDGGLTPSVNLTNPFPGGLVPPAGTALGSATNLGLTPSINYFNYKTPTSYQYSAGFQRELPWQFLLDVSYVGNLTTNIGVTARVDANDIPVSQLGQARSYYTQAVTNPFAGMLPDNAALNGSTIPLQSLLSPYPQYKTLSINNIPIGRNRYDAGQIIISRRFSNGLTVMANYTKSKTLEELVFLNQQDYNPTDPLKSRLDKRLVPFDVPQRLSILGTYELPFGKGKRFGDGLPAAVDYAIGNWKVGWNITQQSGFPINFPNAAPLEAQSAKLPSSQRDIYHWFDTSLFPKTVQDPYTLRTFSSRFPDVRFMGVNNFDFSLIKDLPIKERLRAQIKVDFTNAFNHPYFTNAASLDVTNPSFGQLQLSQQNRPRAIFFDFKLLF
jgi:hypothetical protein